MTKTKKITHPRSLASELPSTTLKMNRGRGGLTLWGFSLWEMTFDGEKVLPGAPSESAEPDVADDHPKNRNEDDDADANCPYNGVGDNHVASEDWRWGDMARFNSSLFHSTKLMMLKFHRNFF